MGQVECSSCFSSRIGSEAVTTVETAWRRKKPRFTRTHMDAMSWYRIPECLSSRSEGGSFSGTGSSKGNSRERISCHSP